MEAQAYIEQEVYQGLGYKRGDFPVAEAAEGEVLSLPMYPELSQEQIRIVTDRLKQNQQNS